jgi:hypothetical protein
MLIPEEQIQRERENNFLNELGNLISPGNRGTAKSFILSLQIFDLLWRLISHDIWFVWERAEYLQHRDDEVLCQVQFKVRQFTT